MNVWIAAIVLCSGALCSGLGAAPAQAQSAAPRSGAPTRKAAAAAGRTECVQSIGLCVTVPASWQRLGNVFEDLGFVVAESHPGADSATWPQLTVAAMDVPEQKIGGGAPSLDSLVDIVLTPDGSFTSAETMQRTRLLLNGNDAEIVRVRLHDESTKTDTIEAVALIEGDDGLVYSIALRCAPEEFARLEPVFQKTAHSWRVKPPAPEAAPQSNQDQEKK